MNGCIFKRTLPSGRITWGFSIDAGKDKGGKRKQIFKSGFERKSDAGTALRQLLNEKDTGDLVVPDPQTFGGFAREWFREYGPRKCTPKTLERYTQLADYLTPHIGGTRLQEITPLMLERVFNRLKDSGGVYKKTQSPRPLSARTVHHIAGVANVMFTKAVKLKLLKLNPMQAVELPSIQRREARAIDANRLQWYLEAARAYGLYEILTFAAATGCRRGEILALAWQDLDLDHSAARISQSLEQTRDGLRTKSTKTQHTRTISLPSSLVALLKLHRERQKGNRRLFGLDYRNDLNLVFCDPQGSHLKPDSVTAKACLVARKAGLGAGVSIHTLRHSHASQLLSAGVSLPTVSKRLGHTDVHTTATIYSHALPKDDLAAAELWEAQFQTATEATGKTKVS